jgi:hypothetical protein
MRKLLNRKVRQQAGICAICHEKFTDYNETKYRVHNNVGSVTHCSTGPTSG